jgi:hypothetical protein
LAPACLVRVDVASWARAVPTQNPLDSVRPGIYATGVHETSGGARRAAEVAVVNVCKQQGKGLAVHTREEDAAWHRGEDT